MSTASVLTETSETADGQSHRGAVLGFFAFLFLLDWYLYFRHAGHFFQADTVDLLNHRVASFSEFLRGFIQLHPSGWYRPLANESIESLLFPVLGLRPVGYHLVVYGLFLAVTIAVYALAQAVTRRPLAAAIATLFFSIHTTNAYTTYDLGFAPELLYTFFYIASVLAYLSYLRGGTKVARNVSLACFVMSLLCKESAVTLPGTLFACYLLLGPGVPSFGVRFTAAIRSTLWHSLILVAYLVFAVGHLHVQGVSIAKLLDPAARAREGGYNVVLDSRILQTADYAATWAFNIPRGTWGRWRHLTPGMTRFLQSFRVLTLALMACLLFTAERRLVLFGVLWFVLTLLPALPLLDHFIPYYLFLPIVGMAIVVATTLLWAYERLRRIQPSVAAAAVVMVLAGLLYCSSRGIRGDIRDNPLLGASAEFASNSLSDLKRLYPVIPAGETVYIDDTEEALSWDHASGGLIKMAYGRDDMSILYASLGQSLTEATPVDTAIVLRVQNKHLLDDTSAYRAYPAAFVHLRDTDIRHLTLLSPEVTAGNSFAIEVGGAHDVPIRIMYCLNDAPLENFTAALDGHGRADFTVSAATRKGVYRFIRFNISGETDWIRSNAAIAVR